MHFLLKIVSKKGNNHAELIRHVDKKLEFDGPDDIGWNKH